VTTTSGPVDTELRSPIRTWNWIGRVAGHMAGTALLAGTVLFLLDAAGFLGSGSAYLRTGAVPLAAQPRWFFAAYFAHQQHIMWDIIARDTILPIAYLAFIIAAVAVRNRTGPANPAGQLVVTLFIVGGILSILADLTFLAAAEYFGQAGWQAASTVAAGRTLEDIQLLTHWPETFGFAILAGGLVALARLCGKHRIFPAALGVLAYLEAVLLLGIAVTGVIPYAVGYNVLSLAAGAVVGPALGIWLGTCLDRTQSPAASL
jgi:hypothetical protein